jgi:hypothetical protein
MRVRILAFLLLLPVTAALAQEGPSRFALGIHGGADIGGKHTIKLLGGELGFKLGRGLRVIAAGTTTIDEPGTLWFALAGVQLHLERGRLRPYVGAGGALETASVGPFSHTQLGWLAQTGLAFRIAGGMPFVEARFLGVSDTRTQLLVGFRTDGRE